jgi:hypothetical protein
MVIGSLFKEGSHDLIILDFNIQIHVVNLHGSGADYPFQAEDGAVHLGDDLFPSCGVSNGSMGSHKPRMFSINRLYRAKLSSNFGRRSNY